MAEKAAEELQLSAGIESRTLHALEYGWRNGRDGLASRDVLVIDEAGMVGDLLQERAIRHLPTARQKMVD